ncbi:MAG: hypothetical protein IIV91_03340 [Alistipes sp.]|nr:hypothetical protein [Alistipes sp.]
MKAIFISCNQALYEEIRHIMAQQGVRGYTALEELIGCGTATGEPHLGDAVWPTLNSALLAVVEDGQCGPFMAALRDLDERNPQLGLRAFWWEVGGTL